MSVSLREKKNNRQKMVARPAKRRVQRLVRENREVGDLTLELLEGKMGLDLNIEDIEEGHDRDFWSRCISLPRNFVAIQTPLSINFPVVHVIICTVASCTHIHTSKRKISRTVTDTF